jgi:hypothetical protein
MATSGDDAHRLQFGPAAESTVRRVFDTDRCRRFVIIRRTRRPAGRRRSGQTRSATAADPSVRRPQLTTSDRLHFTNGSLAGSAPSFADCDKLITNISVLFKSTDERSVTSSAATSSLAAPTDFYSPSTYVLGGDESASNRHDEPLIASRPTPSDRRSGGPDGPPDRRGPERPRLGNAFYPRPFSTSVCY